MSGGRAAPRVEPTSDDTGVRPIWIASGVAAAAAILALSVGGDPRPPGPIARPHARAKIACGACHGEAPVALTPGLSPGTSSACAGCHAGHASARAPHRALEARGDLGCPTCHAGHDAAGVTFADGGYVRWGAGGEREGHAVLAGPSGATVPFVPPSACAPCHDVADARDPAARCVKGDVVVCFDEHRAAPDRYVAWDAAREIAASVPPPAPRTPLAPWGWTGTALGAGALAFVALTRRARPAKAASTPTPAPRVRLPVIDAATCLGCSACVDVCPFDVIAIDRFVAKVVRPTECCGVVHCADACPNGSLRIADGEPVADRPRVDADLESLDTPGVFVAGDLTGLPLIRNAIDQGARVADRVASIRGPRHAERDLLVVGAGPAGLSAMLRAKGRGLRATCLEQSTFAASLRSFPRGKVVFDVPGLPPLGGPLWMGEATKEELIAHWTRAVRSHALDVREGRRVVDVARDGDGFVVTAVHDDGAREEHRAARVLLALGRRGTPRALDVAVAPGAEGKVSHALADARSFAGARVLVVGLGDSAMEAAIALVHAGAEVTVSYRGATFTRGKERNVTELRALATRDRVALVFESRLVAVEADRATLEVAGTLRAIPNDAVFVLIGGEPSWGLVTRAGVKVGPAGV
jgi:thioredoxin reductase/ferredoxin